MKRREELLKIFRGAVETVFSTLTGLSIVHVDDTPRADHRSTGDFCGIIDFSGNAQGTCAVCMPEALLRRISGSLTQFSEAELTDEVVVDTVGEIVNQIAGYAKERLDKTPYGFQIGTPRKLVRQRVDFTGRTDLPCIGLRFTLEGQTIDFLLSIISAEGVPLEAEAADGAEPVAEEPLVVEPDMEEIVSGFVTETVESLDKLEQDLLALESSPHDNAVIDRVFRAYHTLKGNSGALGFEDLQKIVHRTEDVIRKARDGALTLDAAALDPVLRATDRIRLIVADIGERKKRARPLSSFLEALDRVLSGASAAPLAEEKLEIDPDMKEIVEGFIVETDETLTKLNEDLVQLENEPANQELINGIFRALHTIKGNAGALGFTVLQELDHRTEDIFRKSREGQLPITPAVMDVVLRSADMLKGLLEDIRRGIRSKTDLTAIKADLALALEGRAEEIRKTASPVKPVAPAASAGPSAEKKEAATIRVDTAKLSALIDVTGELSLTRNRLLDMAQAIEQGTRSENFDEAFGELSAQLGRQMASLQGNVMSARMQPIGKVFNKYTRVVRDLARDAGKGIDLVITGQETELDNTIVEEIGDPLIHMVRNSCDHGIERPEVRKALGKSERGRIDLKAYQEGGSVIIEIRDDGKGLNPDIILKKALEKGVLAPAAAEGLSKTDILNLIFLPGFSTAEKVTAVSGRGVGMDVVKTSITKLGGVVDLDSEVGRGSTVKIRLPLSLAVMTGLEVEVGGERFLIPQEALVEIVPVDPAAYAEILSTRKFLFRERYLNPVVVLAEALGCPPPSGQNGQRYLVVVGEVEKRTGLVVDNVLRQHEAVVKPLGRFVGRFSPSLVSGATIMGDGSVALILNARSLINLGQARAAREAA